MLDHIRVPASTWGDLSFRGVYRSSPPSTMTSPWISSRSTKVRFMRARGRSGVTVLGVLGGPTACSIASARRCCTAVNAGGGTPVIVGTSQRHAGRAGPGQMAQALGAAAVMVTPPSGTNDPRVRYYASSRRASPSIVAQDHRLDAVHGRAAAVRLLGNSACRRAQGGALPTAPKIRALVRRCTQVTSSPAWVRCAQFDLGRDRTGSTPASRFPGAQAMVEAAGAGDWPRACLTRSFR